MRSDFLKNISASKLSLLILSCLAGIVIVVFGIGAILWPGKIHFPVIVLVIGSLTCIGFFILRFFINKFLYRRIKLIYKIISGTKLSDEILKEGKLNDLSDLEQAELAAQRWINKKNTEIDHIKQMELFRKEYIGNVSHELKTPVFNIQAYLQTIMDQDLFIDEQAKTFLEKALKNTFRLKEVIEDLSIVDRLEAGTHILDVQKFNVKSLAEEVFEEQTGLADQKQIKLIFKEGADNNNFVLADREYIRIVLSNLVNNAIKYGKFNGYVKISFYRLDENILVEVSDNGIGIPEDQLSHVFDRFYRVDKSRSRDQGGSGLGLSIVKHIIEAHHQKLHIRSKDGVGTTIGFNLEHTV
ncbi:MAG: sensor histidine kinase [Saprospiraceae bacterium]|nr:sensor histidine kinase [Saprospiraceae bacterium]